MIYEKALEEAIQAKLDILKRNREQMQADIKAGKLTPRTLECLHNAQESFDAAKLHMKQGKAADAIYLYSRGSWNMGEVMGRSFYEKQDPPDSK